MLPHPYSTIVRVIARVMGLLVLVLVTYKWWFSDYNPQLAGVTVVNADIGIKGTVTGYNRARGYKIYINSSETPYNFDAFVNERLSPDDSLGYYLVPGDSISKQPNSPVLRLTRGGQVSEWRWVAPPADH